MFAGLDFLLALQPDININAIPILTHFTCVGVCSTGEETEVKAFPAHQPILDPAQLKQCYNSFLTTSMTAYPAAPQLKGETQQQQQEEEEEEEEVEGGTGGKAEKGQTRVSFQ